MHGQTCLPRRQPLGWLPQRQSLPSKLRPSSAAYQDLDRLADSAWDAELYANMGSQSEGLRGLHSTEPFRRNGSPLVSIPLSSCLCLQASPTGQACHGMSLDAHPGIPPPLLQLLQGRDPSVQHVWGVEYLMLAAWVLWLKRASNGLGGAPAPSPAPVRDAWVTYVQEVLPPPAETPRLLLALTATETDALGSDELKAEARRQQQWAMEMHKRLQVVCEGVNLRDSLWALAMARSRSFELSVQSNGSRLWCWPPLIDLVNGDVKSRANVEVVLSGSRLQLVPIAAGKAGDALLLDYGFRDSITSLADYGFVMEQP